MQENYQDLCDIVRALEKQQVTAVRSLMQSHVRRFNRYMNSQQPSGNLFAGQGGSP
jgi:DNA-binding FadR family transcriptional regulator